MTQVFDSCLSLFSIFFWFRASSAPESLTGLIAHSHSYDDLCMISDSHWLAPEGPMDLSFPIEMHFVLPAFLYPGCHLFNWLLATTIVLSMHMTHLPVPFPLGAVLTRT
jgi:hypothetical protein